jgi:hypothetical protein
LDEIGVAGKQFGNPVDNARCIDRLALKVFHDIKESVVYVRLVVELNLDLVKIGQSIIQNGLLTLSDAALHLMTGRRNTWEGRCAAVLLLLLRRRRLLLLLSTPLTLLLLQRTAEDGGGPARRALRGGGGRLCMRHRSKHLMLRVRVGLPGVLMLAIVFAL